MHFPSESIGIVLFTYIFIMNIYHFRVIYRLYIKILANLYLSQYFFASYKNKGSQEAKQRGFTLIELLITLAIMSIVFGFAAPSFQSVINRTRLTTQSNNIVEALNIARSNAISKKYESVVAPLVGTKWSEGYQVYLDKNGNGTFEANGDEVLQTYTAPLSTGITLNPSLIFANKITYKPDGRILENVAGIDKGIYVCSPKTDANFRRVTVFGTGRIRTEKPPIDAISYTDVLVCG